MNKIIAVIIVLLVSIIFIGGISVMAVSSAGGDWSWPWERDWNWPWEQHGWNWPWEQEGWNWGGGERVNVDESAGLNVAGVTEAEISLPFGNVDIEVGEPGVSLNGHFNVSEKKDKYLFVTTEGGKLRIEFDPGTLPHNQDSSVRMTVRLPQELAASLKLTNSSGDIRITGVAVKNMTVSNQSGNVELKGCSGGILQADLSSGNITITSGSFESVDASCQSGNVRVENTSGPVNVQSTSGNIDISVSDKNVSAITASLTSGNVNLYLDPQAAFTLDARTFSGNVSCEFDILVNGGTDRERLEGNVGGGGAAVKLTTTSGNVNVLKR